MGYPVLQSLHNSISTLALCHIKHHIRSVHEGIKDNKCDLCDYCTSFPSDLKKHIKKFHKDPLNIETTNEENEKTITCGICGKKLRDSYQLKHHVRNVHEGVFASDLKERISENHEDPLNGRMIK